MPSFEGQLKEKEIDGLIAFIKSLKQERMDDHADQRSDTPCPRAATAARQPEPDFRHVAKGLKSWLVHARSQADRDDVPVRHPGSLIVGGAFALLVRTELCVARARRSSAQDTYNQFFTLHGAVMVFLVIIPGIPAALGNIIMPIQLGAPDVAFPRLNLAVVLPVVLRRAAARDRRSRSAASTPAGRSTRRTASSPQTPVVDRRRCGVFLLGFCSIFTGLNFLVTIHKFRPQGMGWFQMPLNIWAIYATAIMQVLATPVLGITVLLLAVERVRAHRHLRSDARRRPGAVPALLLVLLAPGRLHHDHPGHGRDQRADLDVLAQADLRLPLHRVLVASRSRCCRSSCGATTCSCRASRGSRTWCSRR